MDNGNQLDARQRLVDEVDLIIESPGIRTRRVYEVLVNEEHGFTNWDVICFCSEYLALQAATFEWLEPVMRHLVKLIYNFHYHHYKEIQIDNPNLRQSHGILGNESEHLSDGSTSEEDVTSKG